MSSPPTNIPLGVTLVSGFLGSGKTTLVNRLLSAEHGVRMGVLVNDFGDIHIDQKLIVSRSEDTVTLSNGCICCTLRDDLATAIFELSKRDVEHIVVEASGIADPRVLTQTFIALDKEKRVALDAVVVVVDSEQLSSYDPANKSLARDQLSQANVVLLNKTDLATAEQMAAAVEEVARFCPRAAVIRCQHADVPIELVLGVGSFDAEQFQDASRSSHSHGFQMWSFTCNEPLSLARVREAATDLPANVFRAKGLVSLRERPDDVCVLQIVGRRARIDLGPRWGDTPRHTEIVFIGRNNIDRAELERVWRACTEPPTQPTKWRRARSWLRSRFPL
jgi:G3E family GTPase